MRRYEYDIVRVRLEKTWKGKLKTDYLAIIDEYAEDGWRLIDVFTPSLYGYGSSRYADFIFERPIAPEHA